MAAKWGKTVKTRGSKRCQSLKKNVKKRRLRGIEPTREGKKTSPVGLEPARAPVPRMFRGGCLLLPRMECWQKISLVSETRAGWVLHLPLHPTVSCVLRAFCECRRACLRGCCRVRLRIAAARSSGCIAVSTLPQERAEARRGGCFGCTTQVHRACHSRAAAHSERRGRD